MTNRCLAEPSDIEEALPSEIDDPGGISLRVPDRPPLQQANGGCCSFLLGPLINTRCTEKSVWALSAVCGLLALSAQTAPIFLLDWVHVREPRPLNITKQGRPVSLSGEDRGPLEVPFEYNAGYFGVCRHWLSLNHSGSTEGNAEHVLPPEVLEMVPQLAPDSCVWNPLYTEEDLGEYSFATSAILVRLLIPTVLHCTGALATTFALLFSFLGHFGRSWKTICAAILYVVGGLVVLIGVLQVICVVDDEMAPRMKPNAAGEPSAFSFRYGISFMAAALSFLPVQLCVWLEVTAFFRRFQSPAEKSRVVPGLQELLNQVTLIRTRTHRLGRLGGFAFQGLGGGGGSSGRFGQRRRESRASRDFGVLGSEPIMTRNASSVQHLLVV